MKKIAVLLTCYNRVDTTLECLQRLFAQKVPNGYSFDAWLVDDASPDKTGEKVKVVYPQVNVIQGNGHLFWAGGMRLAWKTAAVSDRYDYYLWLNDDVKLYDDALARLIHCEEMSREDSIISGTLIDPNTGRMSYGCYGGCGLAFKNANVPEEIKNGLYGNVVLISSRVFNRIGGMAEGFVHQHGDFEYGYRARKNGIKVYAISPVGTCVANYGFDKKKLLCMNIRERFDALFSPKGIGIIDYCRYKYLTVGLWGAACSLAKGILTALLPRLIVKAQKGTGA